MAEQFLKTKPTQEIKMQNILVQNAHPQGAGLTEWLKVLNKLPAEGATHPPQGLCRARWPGGAAEQAPLKPGTTTPLCALFQTLIKPCAPFSLSQLVSFAQDQDTARRALCRLWSEGGAACAD